MACWYCYWGWAEPVANIYIEAVKKLGGDFFMYCGPAGIVWANENFNTEAIEYSIDNFEEMASGTEMDARERAIIMWSLTELLKIDEEERDIEPKDMEGGPENYPPSQKTIRI